MAIIGVRAHDYTAPTAQGLFAAIGADGWQSIQLAPQKALPGVRSQKEVTEQMRQELNASLLQNNLSVAVLGAYIEPSLAEETQRKQQVQEFLAGMQNAKALNAGCVGTETTNREKQPAVSQKEAMAQLKKSLAEILPLAEELALPVAIEPVYYHTMATPELTKEVLDDMQSPWLKVILDPVNLLAPDAIKHQQSLWHRCAACFGGKIAAFHIKGVRLDGGEMLNCPLEQSIVNYSALLQELGPLPSGISFLRELAVPAQAKQDIRFIQSLL